LPSQVVDKVFKVEGWQRAHFVFRPDHKGLITSWKNTVLSLLVPAEHYLLGGRDHLSPFQSAKNM